MKAIVCATDFSSNAGHAIQYSLSLAKKINGMVYLLHAYESPIAFSEMPMTAILGAEAQIRIISEKKLEKIKRKAAEQFPSVSIETIIQRGQAAKLVTTYADKIDADLIVVGKTGTGKVERFFIGSTASKVIQKANCPVLCIPKGYQFGELKKIVFATDLHENNLMATRELLDFAKLFQAEINFLFVDDKRIIHSDETINDMTKKIRQRVKYPKISGYVCKNTKVADGIVYFLKHHPADLLAMFTKKKKFPDSLFHPSITKAMASKTSLPLFVLVRSERMVF